MTALEEIARFASSLELRSLPAEVVEKAKICILDTLSGCFLVASDDRAQAALKVVPLDAAGSRASVIGSRYLAAPADAAFVNAASTAASDRSDTYPATGTHPGIMTVPAALALAEHRARSGAELIVAVVAGYETMGRLARALITPEVAAIFRTSALAGPTSGAVAASRVLGLGAKEIAAAAALATHTAVGFNEWAHAGTGEHPFHAAVAGRNVVTAALLAEAGVAAAPSVLEGRSGLLAAHGRLAQSAILTGDLGHAFEILDVVHKPAPACFFVQAPCQLAQDMVRRERLDAETIDRVEIRVTDAAARFPGCDNAGPIRTVQDAIMSLQFSVAAVLMHGSIRAENWRAVEDQRIQDLAARTVVVADPALTAASPARQGVGLKIRRHDGSAVEALQDDFRSMSRGEVVDRFLAQAEPVLGPARAAAAVEHLSRLECLRDVRELTELLRL